MSLHEERGAMVVADVAALPPSPLVVAEGSTVPAWVVSNGAAPDAAIWLLPTPEFQRASLGARASRLASVLTETIEAEAREHGAPVLRVDGTTGIQALTAAVEAHFARMLAAGPSARSPAERQALLREANLAVVGQVRGYHARPWSEGDAEASVRTFLCECGDPACPLDVRASVADAAAGPVLAHGRPGEPG